VNTVLELSAFRGLPVWELPAAHYLLMIQAGAFAMLAGCASRALGLQSFADLRLWGVLAATGLVLAAPLNLVAELLSPERFPSMLYRVHLSSPLSWGAWAIMALTALGLLECLLLFRPGRPDGAGGDGSSVGSAVPDGAGGDVRPAGGERAAPRPNRLVPRLTSLAALGVIVYTAIEIGNAKGVAPWSGFWPLATLLSSGLAAGLAVCLGLARLDNPARPDRGQAVRESLYRRILAVACALSGLALLGWGELAARPVLSGWAAWPEAAVLPVLGAAAFLLAAVLSSGRSFAQSRARFGRFGRFDRFAWACLLATAGAWVSRVAVLSVGQAAALGRNLGEPHLVGHAGLLTAVAPLAFWIVLMLAASIAVGRLPGLALRAKREGGGEAKS